MSDVNYVTDVPALRKGKKLLHVNLFKPYCSRKQEVLCSVVPGGRDAEESGDQDDFGKLKGDIKLNISEVLRDTLNCAMCYRIRR